MFKTHLTAKQRASKLLAEFKVLESAAANTACKRKGVGCCLLMPETLNEVGVQHINGPAEHLKSVCTGEIGKCGCPHSEPRCIVDALRVFGTRTALVMVANYSPCNGCADVICLSGIITVLVYDHYAAHHPQACEAIRNRGIAVLSGDDLRMAIMDNEVALAKIDEAFK